MQDAQSAVNARVQEAGARVQQAQEMVESHVQEVSQRVNALRQERDKPASGANGKAASEEAGAGKEDAKQAE